MRVFLSREHKLTRLDRNNRMNTKTQVKPASPREIAYAIESDWKNVSPYAQPYLQAMKELDSVDSPYFADSGASVIMYFLANAASYRGEGARAYKALLKAMVK